MKRQLSIALFCLSSTFGAANVLAADGHAHGAAAPTAVDQAVVATEAEVGYFLGYSFGDSLRRGGTDSVDSEALMRGVADALSSTDPKLTQEQQRQVIALVTQRQQKLADQRKVLQEQAIDANQGAGIAYLAANATKAGVKTTESGLQYREITAGSGPLATIDNKVVVHYKGSLIDGTVFDSSYKRNEPAEFGVTQVIAGWTEALQLMKKGTKLELVIPADLAYGPGGTGSIPPMSVLVFEVELMEIK